MTYEFYKVLHFCALILTFTSLIGSFSLRYFVTSETDLTKNMTKKFSMGHGIGLTLVLISGFGLAARLGYLSDLPGWIYGKIALWLIAGGMVALVKRKKLSALITYLIIISLPMIGSILAVNKLF